MTSLTTRFVVSFSAPFSLSAVEGALPAGRYKVVVEEEPLDVNGLSPQAFRRRATFLRTPSIELERGITQLVAIDLRELDAAILRDRGQAL